MLIIVMLFPLIAYGQQTTTEIGLILMQTFFNNHVFGIKAYSYETPIDFYVLIGLFGIIIAVGYESFSTIYDDSHGVLGHYSQQFLILLIFGQNQLRCVSLTFKWTNIYTVIHPHLCIS